MHRQRGLARTYGHIASGSFGPFCCQPSEKDVRPAIQYDLIAPRRDLNDAIGTGSSLITACETGASTFSAVGRKASALGVRIDQGDLHSAVASLPGTRVRIRNAIKRSEIPAISREGAVRSSVR